MVANTLVLLGFGYTARFVLPLASHRYAQVLTTSRDPAKRLLDVPAEHHLRFDLSDPHTWSHVPDGADLLWCFPASPLELVKEFADNLHVSCRRLVVLASTSAYDVGPSTEYPPPWIDETAPIDLTKPRVQGEEYLRRTSGAVILRVAGIYGPKRNPLGWIKSGRVSPSRRFVNLIHAEDLAAICLAALERGVPGKAYNVSDGTPRSWQDICDTAQARWGLTPSPAAAGGETGKRISNVKLTNELGYTVQHPDLYHELEFL